MKIFRGSTFLRTRCSQGLKWGRIGDLAPFDPGLYRVSSLLSYSSKSHIISPRMHQNSPFSDQI